VLRTKSGEPIFVKQTSLFFHFKIIQIFSTIENRLFPYCSPVCSASSSLFTHSITRRPKNEKY
jgi:hypothetical protein